MVRSFSDFEPQPGFKAFKAARNKTGRTYEVKPESERRLSFVAFVEAVAPVFPDLHLRVHTYQHSEKPKRHTYSFRRPVVPGIVVPKRS